MARARGRDAPRSGTPGQGNFASFFQGVFNSWKNVSPDKTECFGIAKNRGDDESGTVSYYDDRLLRSRLDC